MPTLQDTYFSKSVVYLHEHSANGAMGIVINKSLQITLENLLQHLDIEVTNPEIANVTVLSGGPIGPEQGFVIHDRIDQGKKKKKDQKIDISSSKEMLHEISQGHGPNHYLVALGYSGWEQGQLEQEISRNDWLIAPVNEKILFSTTIEKRWQKAAESIGVDINRLSGHFGHA